MSGARSAVGDGLVEPRDRLGRGAGRGEDAEPGIAALLAVSGLLQGRHIGKVGMAHLGQDRERACSLPALMCGSVVWSNCAWISPASSALVAGALPR